MDALLAESMKLIRLIEFSPVQVRYGDPDPVQSGLVDEKPIQSSPFRLLRTVHIFVLVLVEVIISVEVNSSASGNEIAQ